MLAQLGELRHRGPWPMLLTGAAHPISQHPPSSRHWSFLFGEAYFWSTMVRPLPVLVPQPMCGSPSPRLLPRVRAHSPTWGLAMGDGHKRTASPSFFAVLGGD